MSPLAACLTRTSPAPGVRQGRAKVTGYMESFVLCIDQASAVNCRLSGGPAGRQGMSPQKFPREAKGIFFPSTQGAGDAQARPAHVEVTL